MIPIVHGNNIMIPIVYGNNISLGEFIDIINDKIDYNISSVFKFKESILRDQKNQEAIVAQQIKSPFILFHNGSGISEGYTGDNNLNEYIDNIKHISNIEVTVSIAQLNRKKYENLFKQKISYLILVSNYNELEPTTNLITNMQTYYDRNKSDYSTDKTKKTIDFDYIEEVMSEENNFNSLLVEKNQQFIMPYYLNYKKDPHVECSEFYGKEDNLTNLTNKQHIHKCIICGKPKNIYVDNSRNNLDRYINIDIESRIAKQVCINCKKSQRGEFEFEIPESIDINDKKDIFYYMCKTFKWEDEIIDMKKFKFGDKVKFDEINIPEVDIRKEHIYYCPICNNKNSIFLEGNKNSSINDLFSGIYDNKELLAVEINCSSYEDHPNSKKFRFQNDDIVLEAYKKGKANKLLYYLSKKIRYCTKSEFEYLNKENNIVRFSIEKLMSTYD